MRVRRAGPPPNPRRCAAGESSVIARALHAEVWPLLAAGTVRPIVHARFPLADAAGAHRLMESSEHIGKIVLEVCGS